MKTIPLQNKLIYGPVNSRRLGCSLGINILPLDSKVCSFDCLYCQYGWTQHHVKKVEMTDELPTPESISEALKSFLINYKESKKEADAEQYPLYVTFSGNGEPTLHPMFPEIVDTVINVRDRVSPSSKTAILSNSTTVDDPKIRATLDKLDVRIMKLDAGNSEVFNSYNRPADGIKFEDVVKGLALLKEVTVQTLFTGGKFGNYTESNISGWLSILKTIKPKTVQLYSLDRGYPSKSITSVNKEELQKISVMLKDENISSEVFSR